MAGYSHINHHVMFDQPTPRGVSFLAALAGIANRVRLRVPGPDYDPMPGPPSPPFGYQEALTTLGSFYRPVPRWAVDGPPTARPLAPALVQPLPSARVSAARAAFYQNLPQNK